jgi:hypothetical protein
MRKHWILLITLLTLVLTSCGASQTNGQNENPIPPSPENLSTPLTEPEFTKTEQPAIFSSPMPNMSEVQLPEAEDTTFVPRAIIEKIKADLAQKFGVNADKIRVVEARAITWQDASLGCPQPDMAYAQVITPGYWFLLEANGQSYPYHTDQNEQIVLCLGNLSNPESELPLIPVNPDEIDDGQPWMPVN